MHALSIRLLVDMSGVGHRRWIMQDTHRMVTINSNRSSDPKRDMVWEAGLCDFAFGCPVYGLVDSQEKNKHEDKSRFVDFTTWVKGSILWDSETWSALTKGISLIKSHCCKDQRWGWGTRWSSVSSVVSRAEEGEFSKFSETTRENSGTGGDGDEVTQMRPCLSCYQHEWSIWREVRLRY